jgi:flavin reductase (DIM6/NTAB) family NADH-FMN oxidoreductase RutF
VLRREQLDLARHFGTRSGKEMDKLAGQRWHHGALGAPVLDQAAAYLECRITGWTPAGDHEIILAEAVGGAVIDDTAEPMSYAQTGDLDGSSALYPGSFEEGS